MKAALERTTKPEDETAAENEIVNHFVTAFEGHKQDAEVAVRAYIPAVARPVHRHRPRIFAKFACAANSPNLTTTDHVQAVEDGLQKFEKKPADEAAAENEIIHHFVTVFDGHKQDAEVAARAYIQA